MNDLERREFLRLAGCGAAASMLPGVTSRLFFQDKTEAARKAAGSSPVLVVIYQRGGMDAMNACVPYGDKRYYELRPQIGIPPKDGDDGPGVVALDATFGLHPSMKALKPLYDAKKFAAIINVGSPHTTRSHFDAQDFMEYAAPGLRTVKAGWLNRYLDATKKADADSLRAVAMQGLLPRSLRGEFPALAVPEAHVLNNEKVLDTFSDVYGGAMDKPPDDPVVEAGKETLEILKRYKECVAKSKHAAKAKYPAGGVGAKLKDIASVVHSGADLQVAAMDIGGWDHHANEGGNDGTLSKMLKELSDSLAAFAEDLGEHLDRTLVVVMTEFGRTCRENGNTGTDHGHGGAMWLLGGALKGGRVHGDWAGLDDKSLYEGRDLPVTCDFRDVFASVLGHHMKFEAPKDFFPNYKPKDVKGLF